MVSNGDNYSLCIQFFILTSLSRCLLLSNQNISYIVARRPEYTCVAKTIDVGTCQWRCPIIVPRTSCRTYTYVEMATYKEVVDNTDNMDNVMDKLGRYVTPHT